MSNYLKKMAKFNKKHNKGWGWFCYPSNTPTTTTTNDSNIKIDAGNVEYNNAVFNSGMISNSANGGGQSLGEGKEDISNILYKEELIQSSSDKAFEQNVKTEMEAGKSKKQALAIAYSVKEKNRMKEDVDSPTHNKIEFQEYLKEEEFKKEWDKLVPIKEKMIIKPIKEAVEDKISKETLRTPRGTFRIYEGSWEDFKGEEDFEDWGFWFDHYTPEDADWKNTEKWYKIMHKAKDQSAIAVLYKDKALSKVQEDWDKLPTDEERKLRKELGLNKIQDYIDFLERMKKEGEYKGTDIETLRAYRASLGPDFKIKESMSDSISKVKLRDELLKGIKDYFLKKGYDDSDYKDIIEDYLYIDIKNKVNYENQPTVYVEVRCELGYNSFENLIDKVLDPIVSKYDKDAYFEMEEPGIASAYIFRKTLTEKEDHLVEGAMKDLSIDIEDAGGKEAYITQLEKEIKDLTDYRDYLDTTATKEVGRGGNFDSIDDVEEAKSDVEDKLRDLYAKLDVVNNTDGD